MLPQLGQHFRPEFPNRIDEIIIFRGLDRAQPRQITTLLPESTVAYRCLASRAG